MNQSSKFALSRLVRFMYDAQRLRMQAAGRNAKHANPVVLDADDLTQLDALSTGLSAVEKTALGEIETRVKADPMGRWLLGIRGIGPVLAGVILTEIDPARCGTVSALWRYAGCDPSSGGRRREGTKSPYNGFLKTKLLGVAGDSFLKSGVRLKRPAKNGAGWIEKQWAAAYEGGSDEDDEVVETPDVQDRAAAAETTAAGKRAEANETSVGWKRAELDETPVPTERAEACEESDDEKRAVVEETPVAKERAVREVPTVTTERADGAETTDVNERAAAQTRFVTGYATIYADYRWRLLHRRGPCMACGGTGMRVARDEKKPDEAKRAVAAKTPGVRERADRPETPVGAEHADKAKTPVDLERAVIAEPPAPRKRPCFNCRGSGTGPWGRSKPHRHRAAIRYMVKMFLRDVYVQWRTLEGLEVRSSYAEGKLGIVHSATRKEASGT